MYEKHVKRILDIILSLFVFPWFLLTVVVFGPLIYFEDKGSVFYLAKRRGRFGKVFYMYKFRTMRMNAPDYRNADNSTYNSSTDPRVTKIGRFMRGFSIDELPQVLNILKGDMSFIGPRPVTVEKPVKDYDQKRLIRLRVRPGLTGYAQAYFRNSISQEEKFEMDAYYAENVSFHLDMKIFFKTIQTVLTRKGIYKNAEDNS